QLTAVVLVQVDAVALAGDATERGLQLTPRGSARIYYEDEGMQANNLPDALKSTLGGVTGKGNRITLYKDYGGELGGPIWRDRIWAWGAYGKTDVTLLTL